ncbi:hypothetical protein CDD81_1383 [Ophiocordyceps australis]|uniref:Myocyte-specific enhancer factor 2d n=1 Tax=Ophiocordyceps australis TaxID=1399860 RepID=A0A2C5Y086_9HYPO|nr:hypothetical protein CDD81_1383 [Ophiocordyceps australis]
MMSAAEIPGYYWDKDRRKYFKIEKSQTAPTEAAWSRESVKRRKVQDEQAEAEQARREEAKMGIRRHGRFHAHAMAGGMLAREMHGGGGGELDGGAAWAAGVVGKGQVEFGLHTTQPLSIGCLYVNGDDSKTGMGAAYLTLDDQMVLGTYLPTDANSSISFARAPSTMPVPSPPGFWPEMIRCPQMSSMRYHEPSSHMLLTSRQPDTHCGIYLFSPIVSDAHDTSRPNWLLGQISYYKRISMGQRHNSRWQSNTCCPAPASSNQICVVATNAGILSVSSNEESLWLAPPRERHRLTHHRACSPLDVLDLDYQMGNPNVVFAGGRKPLVWTIDMRAPEADWLATPLVAPPSSRTPRPRSSAFSISHLRSINPFHILAAGPCDAMAIYDIRSLAQSCHAAHIRRSGASEPLPLAKPLVTFPHYRNAAHIHSGWDVSPQLGVVATAHDDGSFGLFSLRTGRLLQHAATIPSTKLHIPIRAMQFQTMPTELLPSLFVAEGSSLRKYSFGANKLHDEA